MAGADPARCRLAAYILNEGNKSVARARKEKCQTALPSDRVTATSKHRTARIARFLPISRHLGGDGRSICLTFLTDGCQKCQATRANGPLGRRRSVRCKP